MSVCGLKRTMNWTWALYDTLMSFLNINQYLPWTFRSYISEILPVYRCQRLELVLLLKRVIIHPARGAQHSHTLKTSHVEACNHNSRRVAWQRHARASLWWRVRARCSSSSCRWEALLLDTKYLNWKFSAACSFSKTHTFSSYAILDSLPHIKDNGFNCWKIR